MKANELRIGNYVYFKHCDYDGSTPRKINYTLNPNLVGLERISVNRIEYNNIDAIPLTEEWLLKFGFKKATENFYSIKTKKRFSNLEINLKSKRAIIFGLGSYKDIIFTEYVHQLQNLYFALTGEELILNEPL